MTTARKTTIEGKDHVHVILTPGKALVMCNRAQRSWARARRIHAYLYGRRPITVIDGDWEIDLRGDEFRFLPDRHFPTRADIAELRRLAGAKMDAAASRARYTRRR